MDRAVEKRSDVFLADKESKKALKRQLEEYKLDADYWCEVMKVDLDISSIDDILFIKECVLQLLLRFARSDIEKDKLQKLLDFWNQKRMTDKGQKETIEYVSLSSNELVKHVWENNVLSGINATYNLPCIFRSHGIQNTLKDKLVLKKPIISEKIEIFEFKNKLEKDVFFNCLQVFGPAMPSECFEQLGIKIGHYLNILSKTENKGEFNYSKVKCFIVPTNSFKVNKTSVSLSEKALSDLQFIELQINNHASNEIVSRKCMEFFEQFGSHVNVGVLHVGGVFTVTASFLNTSTETHDETYCKDIVDDILDIFPHSMLKSELRGRHKFSGKDLVGKIRSLHRYCDTDLSNCHLELSVHGGTYEPDYNVWRQNLLLNSHTWRIIKHGYFAGVWDLLENHRHDFEDYFLLANILERVWNEQADYTVFENLSPTPNCLLANNEFLKKREGKTADIIADSVIGPLAISTDQSRISSSFEIDKLSVTSQVSSTPDDLPGGRDIDRSNYQMNNKTKASPTDINLDSVSNNERSLNSAPIISERQERDAAESSSNKRKTNDEVLTPELQFSDMIAKLDLNLYYPSKITLSEVMEISENSSPARYSDLPWLFLKNLIMINHYGRDVLVQSYLDVIEKTQKPQSQTSEIDNIDDLFDEEEEKEEINPLDLTYLVYQCCSPSLKQILATKLFMCKLAMPILLPNHPHERLQISVWPLRGIILDRKTKDATVQHMCVECPSHFISFLRMGRPAVSKSKLINDVIASQYHNTFFNIDCELGKSKRYISDGLVEAMWYLPTDKLSGSDVKSTELENITLFLNLRGDIADHEKQLEFISDVSSVSVIVLGIDLLNGKKTKELLWHLHSKVDGVLLAIDAHGQGKERTKNEVKTYRQSIQQFESKTRFVILGIAGDIKSASDIKKVMKKGLIDLIQISKKATFLEKIEKNNSKYNVDENEYTLSKRKAESVFKMIPTEERSNVKEKVVPLQGDLWKKWTESTKKQNKSSQVPDIQQSGNITTEMDGFRNDQLELFRDMHPLMKTFLNLLTDDQSIFNADKTIFVDWLKLFLDERSRAVLPTFLAKYRTDWHDLKQARDRAGKGEKLAEDVQNLRKKLNESEYLLAEASFGFEHLIREVGQMYECIKTNKKSYDSERIYADKLAKAVANLLLIGIPFEIMDGDVANVPLHWVRAVLEQLRSIIGDKKLFALSVLGIQSSGKSTLLNTMFGLQFAVSAGRCTRGVFMQLVKVDKHSYPFEYVLVIDTEGLRAPELAYEKHTHDNELATFVIGLGDVTIINVKGENTSEVKDVLQIAVHAFLRLKLANKNINLKQSCVFVHQNVPACDAIDKMMQGRQKFVEVLDEMTKEAAEGENIVDIHSFNQVIDFDSEKDVWYFSDLWHGNPPMAPANPGYSESVVKVKKSIFHQMTKIRETYLTLSDTITRIEDLWKGILTDDFVFSFRNSLELKAFNSMEQKYQLISWNLEKSVSEFILSTAETELVNSNTEVELENTVTTIEAELSKMIGGKVDILRKEFETFVEENNLKEIMIQWLQRKMTRLDLLVDELTIKKRREILNRKEELRVERMRTNDKTKHEKEINEKARELATSMRGEKPSEGAMYEKFNKMWKIWVNKFPSTQDHEINIRPQIEKVLFERFKSNARYITQWVDLTKSWSYEPFSRLEGTIKVNNILENQFTIHKTLYVFKREKPEVCRQQIVVVIDRIFRQVDAIIASITAQDIRFDVSFVHEIFHVTGIGIDQHNSSSQDKFCFTLLPPFKAMIVVHVANYLVVVFRNLNDRYNEKHSPKAQMEKYKATAWALFKNVVHQNTEEIIAADFFREEIMKHVTAHVFDLLPLKVTEIVIESFSISKYNLLKEIMKELAHNKDFSQIRSFILDPNTFVDFWIRKFTNNTLFDIHDDNLTTYALTAKPYVEKILTQLSMSISKATNGVTKHQEISVSDWRDVFVGDVKQSKLLPLSNDILQHVEDKKISDINNFKTILDTQISEMKEKILSTFRKTNKTNIQWKTDPVLDIMTRLWGCEAKCMFCNEPCKNTGKDHLTQGIPHKCIQHRLSGIGGFRDVNTSKMGVEFCNFLIQGDTRYRFNDNEEWRDYKKYKDEFPDWDIEPTGDTSKYWMWLMCQYHTELSEMYSTKEPDIPKSWYEISMEDAIESL